jgi:hypothetical protein
LSPLSGGALWAEIDRLRCTAPQERFRLLIVFQLTGVQAPGRAFGGRVELQAAVYRTVAADRGDGGRAEQALASLDRPRGPMASMLAADTAWSSFESLSPRFTNPVKQYGVGQTWVQKSSILYLSCGTAVDGDLLLLSPAGSKVIPMASVDLQSTVGHVASHIASQVGCAVGAVSLHMGNTVLHIRLTGPLRPADPARDRVGLQRFNRQKQGQGVGLDSELCL